MAWSTWGKNQAKMARRIADDRLRANAEQRAKQMQYDSAERQRMASYSATSLADLYTQRLAASTALTYDDMLRAYNQLTTPMQRKEYHKMSKLQEWQYDYNRLGFTRKDGSFIGDKVLHQIGIHQDTDLTDDMITSAFVDEKLRICKEENINGEKACDIMSGKSMTYRQIRMGSFSGGLSYGS